MNQRLNEAASFGDIDSLYSIIQEDAYILDRIDQVPFVDTPLHISASAGHAHFSLEIMRLKPSFAKKLNPKGYSPIHLALQNNQRDTVIQLVNIDPDLVSIKGREGLSPLHIAACGGKDDILAKFLVLSPNSIKELSIRQESALHIAVKNGDIQSFKILLEWIQMTCMTSILNWSDDEGNNVMHLAALVNQIAMVKLLTKDNKVDMKSKNLKGKTAMDIMKEQGLMEEYNELLKQPNFSLWSFMKRLALATTHNRKILSMSKEDRNAILVVSVLIATATYQGMLTPPNAGIDTNNNYTPISFKCFSYFNTFAFVASLIEIFVHLPSTIGYSLHLLLHFAICYIFLMLYWWSVKNIIIIIVLLFVLLLIKIFILRGDLKSKKLMKFGSPKIERELLK